RDFHVTGVQTCALPIWPARAGPPAGAENRTASQVHQASQAGQAPLGRERRQPEGSLLGRLIAGGASPRPSASFRHVEKVKIYMRSEERRVGRRVVGEGG